MERVDLGAQPHAERERWRCGGEWDAWARFVAVGQLRDGRWYVRRYGAVGRWPYRGPIVYASEHLARGTARRWMRTLGGEWITAGKV